MATTAKIYGPLRASYELADAATGKVLGMMATKQFADSDAAYFLREQNRKTTITRFEFCPRCVGQGFYFNGKSGFITCKGCRGTTSTPE